MSKFKESDWFTLRDHIAIEAMNGELSAQSVNEDWPDGYFDQLAERCYKIADAMLKAREEK